jgi:hypothetical protein
LKVLLQIGHVEMDLSSGVAVTVVEEEKEELGIKEVCSGGIGVGVADAGTNGVEDVRTVSVGVFVA